MPSATDFAANRSEQEQDETDHEDDDTDRPQDRDLEQKTDKKQDDTYDDHLNSCVAWATCRYQPDCCQKASSRQKRRKTPGHARA
jgi:hypothetical protein